MRNDGKCEVKVCTSLENAIPDGVDCYFSNSKLFQVRKGNTYPIPVNDSTFKKWTGVNHNSVLVDKNKILNIGSKRINGIHKYRINRLK